MQIVDPARYDGGDSIVLEKRDRSFLNLTAPTKIPIEGYGHQPVYFASIHGGRPDFLMPIKEVASLLTGKKGVLVRYSEEYAITSANWGSLPDKIGEVLIHGNKAGWRFIERRQASFFPYDPPLTETDITHDINLQRSEQELFAPLKKSNRRCIPKAIENGSLSGSGQGTIEDDRLSQGYPTKDHTQEAREDHAL